MTLPALADLPTTTKASDPRQALVFQSQRIRGVCVLAIILIHVTPSFHYGTPFGWVTALQLYMNSLARFGVPCFVLLSGFFLSLNARNERPLPFYRRTVRFLLVPYVVYSAGYVVFAHRQFTGIIEVWLWAMLTGTAFYHLWFIPVIVQLYLLHPFLRTWYRRTGQGGGLVVTALVIQTVWAVATPDLAAQAMNTDTWLTPAAVSLSFLSYIGYFVAGYYLNDHAADVDQVIRRRGLVIVAALGWVTAAAVMTTGRAIALSGGPALGTISHQALAPLLSPAAFVVLAAWRSQGLLTRPIERLVQRSGMYAYGMYYLHPLVLEMVSWGWKHSVALPRSHGLFYVVAFPLVSVFTLFAVKLVARLPFARYLT